MASSAAAGRLGQEDTTAALLQQQIESLKSMEGASFNMETISNMKKIVQDEIVAKLNEARDADKYEMTMKIDDANAAKADYTSKQSAEAQQLEELKGFKKEADDCNAKVATDTQGYFDHSHTYAEAIVMKQTTCCKRDADFEHPRVFEVGPGLVACDFKAESEADCLKTLDEIITGASTTLNMDGSDWEKQDASCKQQQAQVTQADATHDKNYEDLKNFVASCKDSVNFYNTDDSSHYAFVTSNCAAYQTNYQNTKQAYDELKAVVEARIADRKIESAKVKELLCMLDSFIEAQKVDMSVAGHCQDTEHDSSDMNHDIAAIPEQMECNTHTIELVAQPTLVESITHQTPGCSAQVPPFVDAAFVEEPGCPNWCQPITPQPTNTPPPTTKPPTTPPTYPPTKPPTVDPVRAAAEAAAKKAKELADKIKNTFTSIKLPSFPVIKLPTLPPIPKFSFPSIRRF